MLNTLIWYNGSKEVCDSNIVPEIITRLGNIQSLSFKVLDFSQEEIHLKEAKKWLPILEEFKEVVIVLLPSTIQQEIEKFIADKKLMSIGNVICLIISSLNQKVGQSKETKELEAFTFGSNNWVEEYNNQQADLKNVLAKFTDRIEQEPDGFYQDKSIKISFSPSYIDSITHISNPFLLSKIAKLIKENMQYEELVPYEKKQAETVIINYKIGLLQLFTSPQFTLTVKHAKDAYPIIADIFNLAQISSERFTPDAIKQAIKRAK